jgi:hypothetical protein
VWIDELELRHGFCKGAVIVNPLGTARNRENHKVQLGLLRRRSFLLFETEEVRTILAELFSQSPARLQ